MKNKKDKKAKFDKLKVVDKKSKKKIDESVTKFITNLFSQKLAAAKNDLKGIIEQKIKQRIINNNKVTLF